MPISTSTRNQLTTDSLLVLWAKIARHPNLYMRGRKPKPVAMQLMEGDPRNKGKKQLQEALDREPKVTRGLPRYPKEMTGSSSIKIRARRAYEFWKEELEAMQLDFRPDARLLEGASWAYARAIEAEEEIAKNGVTILSYNEEGDVIGCKANPAVHVANVSWKQMQSFCAEFGLSPVSRTRIALDSNAADRQDDLFALLSAPREPRAAMIQTDSKTTIQ